VRRFSKVARQTLRSIAHSQKTLLYKKLIIRRNPVKLLILAALAGSAVAFGATADPSFAHNQCFFVRDVGDRTIAGPRTLYFKVKDPAHMHTLAYFRLETIESCHPGMDQPTQHAGFSITSTRLAARGSAEICGVRDVRITTDGTNCSPKSLTEVSQAEIDALPRRLRP
jgi:hypothetical protein